MLRAAAYLLALVVILGVSGLTVVKPILGLGAAGVIALGVVLASYSQHRGSTPWFSVYGLCVILPLNGVRPFSAYPRGLNDPTLLGSISISDMALLLIAGVAFFRMWTAKPKWELGIPFFGALIFLAGGVVGALATNTWDITSISKFALGAPVVLFIVLALAPNREQCIRMAGGYALGSFISAITAIGGRTDPYFHRAFGLGVHQMHLALSSLFAALFLIGWFLADRRPWARCTAGLMALVCFYAVLLSGARSALFGFLVGLLYMALAGRLKGVIAFAAGGVVSSVVLIALLPLMPPGSALHRLFNTGELSYQVSLSNGQHVSLGEQAIREIQKHPFTGMGLGRGLEAHNLILAAINSAGVLGIIALLMIWLSFLIMAVRLARLGKSIGDWLPIGLAAGIVGYFVLAQFEPMVWDRHIWFYLALALIAGSEQTKQQRQDSAETETPKSDPVATELPTSSANLVRT